MVTGGTDNHLMVVDVASTHGITGRQAEEAIRRCGITLNRNPIPFDPNGPWYTSGLRFGTPAVTTLGMGKAEMEEIAAVVALVLKNIKPGTTKSGARDKTKYTLDEAVRGQAHARVEDLLASYPVYPEIDLPFLHGELRSGVSKSYGASVVSRSRQGFAVHDTDVMLNRSLFEPILESQPRHFLEIPTIGREQQGITGHRDAGYFQIHGGDFHSRFAEAVEKVNRLGTQ